MTSSAFLRTSIAIGVLFFSGFSFEFATGQAPPEKVHPDAGMMRYPDVSATQIVFSFAGDLWVAPRSGGAAVPLSSPEGSEVLAKFSPDGKQIAFIGGYDEGRDIYVMPTGGGLPNRVTYHPGQEAICDWTADNRILFMTNAFAGLQRQTQLYTVAPTGGLPTALPVPYGANGTLSADGKYLAYTPHSTDTRTWKRYRGGMATDIWLFDLQAKSSKRITEFEGTDTLPMFHGNMIYYLADQGPEARLNIWSYDVLTGAREQITKFTDHDVRWPSMGPGPEGKGEIVLQNGPDLYLLDLATRQSKAVEVLIPGDRTMVRPAPVSVGNSIRGAELSPTGQRVIVEARGDVWSLPARNGSPRNLTHSSGSAERDPSPSPDGKSIAYLSDVSGEYELYVRSADGKEEPKQLTKDGKIWRLGVGWSPDSKWITFSDKTGALFILPAAGGELKQIDKNPTSRPLNISWAPDSNWITYAMEADAQECIWLYHVPTAAKHQLTSGMFSDSWPTFDRRGDFLYFASNRRFSSPIYEDLGTTFVYANTDVLCVVPLRKNVKLPWAPKNDEEPTAATPTTAPSGTPPTSEPAKEENPTPPPTNPPATPPPGSPPPGGGPSGGPGGQGRGFGRRSGGGPGGESQQSTTPSVVIRPRPPGPIAIDIEGFEARARLINVRPGNFSNLSVLADGKLAYVRQPARGAEGQPGIRLIDINDAETQERTVADGIGGFSLSADGRKMLVRGQGPQGIAILDVVPLGQAQRPVVTTGMQAMIDPRAEWKQIFLDAWRVQRDYFYDPTMHGVDWAAVRERYSKMLEDASSRDDVTFIIGEMISELNVGHAYIRGFGGREDGPGGGERGPSTGLLGVDFELHEGAYRITKVLQGAAWDVDARNPLSAADGAVGVGDYILAVNRVPVNAALDPWASFANLSGRSTILTVSTESKMSDKAREVIVQPIASETELRYRAWIEAKRKLVSDKTGGKVGYIYVPDTGANGQNDLFRQYYGQREKAALIVDERWNGGGQIPTRFVELLNRPVTNYWALRDGKDWVWPTDSHQGPKCMLINGLAGSGGDAFPFYFKQAGLGKLIGTRTWGGLVGISGNPLFVDGGSVTAPTFAFYEKDGTWGIEGHGVDPDIEVIDDPAKMQGEGDPQLEAAIDHMLKELERIPFKQPARPAYPDRKGFGIKPEDK
jgi:tricorn protease